MVNRLDIGEVVAAQMQQIVESDEHKRIFRKASEDKCCSCTTCGKDCPCKDKCAKDCKGCGDKNHVHDANCAHDKTAGAVNEVIDLLQKISTVQDELGLVHSSVFTMKALAVMVAELKKAAQDDSNDVSFTDLIQTMDPDDRRGFKATEFEDPDIVNLLRRRIEESEGREPSIFEGGVSADPASPLPSSEPPPDEFGGEVVIEPEDHSTWMPGSSRDLTELAPRPEGEELLKEIQMPKNPVVPDFDRTVGERDLPDVLPDEQRGALTVPVPKGAFERLNELLKKQADDGADFEEEPDEDGDAELEALMGEMPYGGGGQMRGHELEALLDAEEDPDEGEMFGLPRDNMDTMYADVGHGSDFDGELENGDFLAKLEDEEGDEGLDPGFSYEREGLDQFVRRPGGIEVPFGELSDAEKDELEENAGLHTRLNMDPDELTTEEVYPEDWTSTPDDLVAGGLGDELDKYEPGEHPDELVQRYHFWNDDEPTAAYRKERQNKMKSRGR